MLKAWAFLRRDFRVETSYRLSFLMEIAGMLVNLFTFYFVARLLGSTAAPFLVEYGGNYFAFVLIGLAFSGYFSVGLNSFVASLRQAQMTGTLEAMLMTPTSTGTIILSSTLWDYSLISLRVVLYLLLGAFLGAIDLTRANYIAAFLVLLLAIVVFSALGVLAASVVMITKRGDPVSWLFSAMFFLLGGVYYPIAVLPDTLQRAARLIPVTYALRALRLAILQGASFSVLTPDLLALGVFAVVLMPLSLFAFQSAVGLAKREASLTQF